MHLYTHTLVWAGAVIIAIAAWRPFWSANTLMDSGRWLPARKLARIALCLTLTSTGIAMLAILAGMTRIRELFVPALVLTLYSLFMINACRNTYVRVWHEGGWVPSMGRHPLQTRIRMRMAAWRSAAYCRFSEVALALVLGLFLVVVGGIGAFHALVRARLAQAHEAWSACCAGLYCIGLGAFHAITPRF